MHHFIKRHRYLLRSVAITVVCLFAFNSMAWAYPDMRQSTAGVNLQAQSILNPILKEAGWENARQIRLELMFILGMSLKIFEGETVPYYDINAKLDEWISSLPGEKRERILKVIHHPEMVRDSKEVEMLLGFLDESSPRPKFSVTASYRSLGEIGDMAESIRIREIPAFHYAAISWPEIPPESGDLMRDLNDKVNYIRGVIDVLCDVGGDIPTVWARSNFKKEVKKVDLEEWLSHGAMRTFEVMTNIILSIKEPEKELLEGLIQQYKEYRIKVEEILLILDDKFGAEGEYQRLPKVVWTEEHPASHNMALAYLMRDFLSADTQQRMELMKKAAELIKKTMEEIDADINRIAASLEPHVSVSEQTLHSRKEPDKREEQKKDLTEKMRKKQPEHKPSHVFSTRSVISSASASSPETRRVAEDDRSAAKSMLANIFDAQVWKVLTFGSTFFHELGHYIWAWTDWKLGRADHPPRMVMA
jgi:hypothetical protein